MQRQPKGRPHKPIPAPRLFVRFGCAGGSDAVYTEPPCIHNAYCRQHEASGANLPCEWADSKVDINPAPAKRDGWLDTLHAPLRAEYDWNYLLGEDD